MEKLKELSFTELQAFKVLVTDMLEKYSKENAVIGNDESKLNIIDLKVKEKLGERYMISFDVLSKINKEIERRVDEYMEKN